MLSYDDAHQILLRFGGDAPWIRHCLAVARVAERVAGIISLQRSIDVRLLTVGALLHDIGRYKTHDPIGHGVEGYRLLTGLGHHREAFICASHVLCGMQQAEAILHGLPDRDFRPRTFEEKLVPMIDSAIEFDRPTTLERRCSSIRSRYKDNPQFLQRFMQAEDIARNFSRELTSKFGFSIERVAAEVLGAGDAAEQPPVSSSP